MFQSDDEKLRVSDAIVRVLDEAGVAHVLGIPGGHTGGLFRSLYQHPNISTHLVREESIGTVMAEAYGRLVGSPIAVIGQGEWIVGNAGQALMEAHLGSSPLLVLTDMTDAGPLSHHGPYQDGSGNYGSWDTRQALASVCKRVMVAQYPAQAVQMVQLALKHASTGEPGPVAVVFQRDSLRGRVDRDSTPNLYPTQFYLPRRTRAIDAELLENAADLLASASRPVIIVGNGVRLAHARDAVLALADVWDSPVVTTASGKGAVDERHARAAGVMGLFGWSGANAVVAESDVVLALGTKLGPVDTGDEHTALLSTTRQTIVQIDIEALNVAWTYPVSVPIVGDLAVQVPEITDRLRRRTMADRCRTALQRVQESWGDGGPVAVDSEEGISPRTTIELLAENVPDDAVVTCDAGENRLFMMQWYRVPSHGEYLQPAAGGGMGYAVPAALGAALAFPGRCAVAVCGDGGFAMSLHALMTAVQEQLPVAVVVLNNGALGWVAHGMGEQAVAAHFAAFDHSAIARAIGCEAPVVRNRADLVDALQRIGKATRPLVIDVPTTMEVSFKDLLSDLDGLDAHS